MDRSESPPEPDRVVGVIVLCNVQDFVSGGGLGRVTRETRGSECDFGRRPSNHRWLVTVRTPQGTTYEIEAPYDQQFRLGQTWPPE